jgi:hypothetical protein
VGGGGGGIDGGAGAEGDAGFAGVGHGSGGGGACDGVIEEVVSAFCGGTGEVGVGDFGVVLFDGIPAGVGRVAEIDVFATGRHDTLLVRAVNETVRHGPAEVGHAKLIPLGRVRICGIMNIS